MLYYIKQKLSLLCTGAASIIYRIADTRELREHITYNGELDQFEIPVSVLNKHGVFCEINRNTNTIEGTSISYYVDFDDKFCFKIS